MKFRRFRFINQEKASSTLERDVSFDLFVVCEPQGRQQGRPSTNKRLRQHSIPSTISSRSQRLHNTSVAYHRSLYPLSFSSSKMPPPTATLRPEPVRAGAKKDSTVASSSKAAGNGDKMARPDQAAYNAEQDQLNKEIGVLREEMVRSRLRISRPFSSLVN